MFQNFKAITNLLIVEGQAKPHKFNPFYDGHYQSTEHLR